MRDSTALLDSVLRDGSFEVRLVADVFYDDDRTFVNLPVTDWSFTWDAESATKFEGSLTVVYQGAAGESLTPQEFDDTLAPFGQEVAVLAKVSFGSTFTETVLLGRWRILDVPSTSTTYFAFEGRTYVSGSVIQLTVGDLLNTVARSGFRWPGVPRFTNSTWDELQAITGLPVARNLNDLPTPANLVYQVGQGGRLTAVQQLMSYLGGVAVTNSMGELTSLPYGTDTASGYNLNEADPVRALFTLELASENVLQCAVRSPDTGDFFCTQATNLSATYETTLISRTDSAGNLLDSMALTGAGHGTSIALEYTAGAIYIWANWEEPGSTTPGLDIVRFPYQPGTWDRHTIGGMSMPYPGGITGGAHKTDMQFDWNHNRVVLRTNYGNGTGGYGLYLLDAFIAGTLTQIGTDLMVPEGPPALQGYCTVGDYLFRYTGKANGLTATPREPPLITQYRWSDGAIVGQMSTATLGRDPNGTYPGGSYEPESCTLYQVGDTPQLYVGVNLGIHGSYAYAMYLLTLVQDLDDLPIVNTLTMDTKAQVLQLTGSLDSSELFNEVVGTYQDDDGVPIYARAYVSQGPISVNSVYGPCTAPPDSDDTVTTQAGADARVRQVLKQLLAARTNRYQLDVIYDPRVEQGDMVAVEGPRASAALPPAFTLEGRIVSIEHSSADRGRLRIILDVAASITAVINVDS